MMAGLERREAGRDCADGSVHRRIWLTEVSEVVRKYSYNCLGYVWYLFNNLVDI